MATAHHPLGGIPARPKKRSRLANRERNWGLFFLAPWILGFMAFFFLPMLASLAFSFTDYHLTESKGFGNFIGLRNWNEMIFKDADVVKSIWVTLRFVLISTPLFMALPLAFAVLLNTKSLIGKRLFRTLFYLPVMVPAVAGTVIWQGMLNPQSGWIAKLLEGVGMESPQWFTDTRWVVPALALIGVWGVGNTMVIMLAGLQSVPTELYEAVKVDGAGPIRTFWHITIPMISPVLFYNLILGVIGGFQYFLQAYVIFDGQGGPDNAALFYMMKLYKEGWNYLEMGYASTLAWGLFIVAILVTAGLFHTAKYWVYYAGEREA